MDYGTCPACGSAEIDTVKFYGFSVCRSCGAIFGDVTERTASNYANYGPMATGSLVDHDAVYYFDFTVDEKRRHGWTNSAREVVQTG